jgi:hypothetical protein
MATTSELIAQAQEILDNLNAALSASYLTPGTFITGRLVMCHEDIYHHVDQHPVPSVDYLEVSNAPSEVVDLVTSLNEKIAEIHLQHIDATGQLRYAHQDTDPARATPALRSTELVSVDLVFEDKAEHVAFCASTKLPKEVGAHPKHVEALAAMRIKYDEIESQRPA